MLCGLRGKFALEPYRSALLLTHPRPLAQDSPTDFVWGCRDPQGAYNGHNLLGLALTQVREELVADVHTQLSALTRSLELRESHPTISKPLAPSIPTRGREASRPARRRRPQKISGPAQIARPNRAYFFASTGYPARRYIFRARDDSLRHLPDAIVGSESVGVVENQRSAAGPSTPPQAAVIATKTIPTLHGSRVEARLSMSLLLA
jgi:hypothetical protein